MCQTVNKSLLFKEASAVKTIRYNCPFFSDESIQMNSGERKIELERINVRG